MTKKLSTQAPTLIERDGSALMIPLPMAIATACALVGLVTGGAFWVGSAFSTLTENQHQMASSLSKIDGRTESFAVLARRVDSAEQNLSGLTNNQAQQALDIRTLQLQIEENKRSAELNRADIRMLQDWQRVVNSRPQP